MFQRSCIILAACTTLISTCQAFSISIRRSFLKPVTSFQKRLLHLSMATSSSVDNLIQCQLDSYAKSSRNALLSSNTHEDGTCTITLENSVLYPEGGGQPCDLGFVNKIPVLEVTKPVALGTEVQVKLAKALDLAVGDEVTCEVDWNRRYDFMQQHTAQVSLLWFLQAKV
jgi:alanyl-tRNA synthetase